MTTVINTHDMNTVMESGDNILYLHQGKKRWQGSSQEIVFSKDEDLNSFIFASKFLQKAKEAQILEGEEELASVEKSALEAAEKPKRKGLF